MHDMSSASATKRMRLVRADHAGMLLVLALFTSAFLTAGADAGGLHGALAAFDLSPEEMTQAERYAERAALSPNPNRIVAWTSQNIVWRAQAWGEWTTTSGSERTCRSVAITAFVRSRDGDYRQDLSGSIRAPISAQAGQRSIAGDEASPR